MNIDELNATLTQAKAVIGLLSVIADPDEGHAITPELLTNSLWTVTDLLDRAQYSLTSAQRHDGNSVEG